MHLILRLEDEQKSYVNLSDIIKSSLLNVDVDGSGVILLLFFDVIFMITVQGDA